MKSILLHDIRSLQNIGSIFRSADGAGWDMVYLTGYSATPPRTEISKTALGAEIYVPWEYYADPMHILDILRSTGHAIYAIEKNDTSTDIFSTKVDGDICLIMWNEVDGVPDILLDYADHVLHIPMHGKKESLNVSIAAAISMYSVGGG